MSAKGKVMKTDRKIKAVKSPPKAKAARGNGPAANKTNGKHPLAGYEHIPVGIVESALDGKYMDVNDEFCRILGYSRRELLRRGIKDCTHEDDYGLDQRMYEQLIAGKIPFYRLEKRFVRKNAGIIWVELTRSLVCDEKGKPLYTVGVVLDISDRKDVEKVLRESVERLRLATGAAQMFMWEWDFQSQSYVIADNFEQVIGFSGGLLPKNKFETLWALSPREDIERISEAFNRAVEAQRDLHALPYRVINPESGQTVWLEISAKIVYDRKGMPERMFGVAQNITESKNIQNEITVISRMPEENPNPVMRIMRDGRISYANPASAALLEDWMEGLQPAIPDELQKTVAQTLTSGLKTEIEFDHLGRHFSFTVVPLVESGYVNLYGKDITESKQAGQALRSSEERMRLAMEASRMVAWEWDPTIDRVTTSENITEVYGLSAVHGAAAAFSLILPEDLPAHQQKVERVTRDGGEYHSEFRVTRPVDGRVIWMEERATALTDAAGHVTRLVGVVTDITDRKQTEKRLALLAEISEMLRNFDDPNELMYAISEAVGEHLGVQRALFNEIDLEHDREIVHRDYHRGLDSVAGVHKISDYSSITSAEVASGRTVVNQDSKTDPRTAGDYEKTYAMSGERAYVVVPLMRDNRWVASLWVSDVAPRQWSSEEVSLLETVAERTWAIIEKLRINAALRESEQRFREIFETAGVSVWVEDFSEVKRVIEELRLQGIQDLRAYFRENPDFVQRAIGLVRIIDVNTETLELFRASSKDALLGSLSKVFAPETEAIFIEELVALAEGREMLRDETQIRTLDREPIAVLFTVHFAPPAGDQSRVVVTLTDITERKNAEEALRESEQRYRFIVENTSDGIWWIELTEPMPISLPEEQQIEWYYRHAVIRQCNLGLARMYGYDSVEDVIGLPMRVVMPPSDPLNLELSRRFIRSGYRLVDSESVEMSHDGRELVFLNNMIGIIEDGKLKGEWGTNRDITQRKRAEEALRRNEQMFSTLVDAAPFGVYFIDSEFRLRTINKGSEAVFSGIDPLLGRDFAEVLRIIWHEPFATEAIEQFRHTLRTGESFLSPPIVEERANISDIEAYDWQIHRITLADGTYGVVCYFYDLSEQKKMEATVRASESLYRTIARSIPGGGVYVVDKDFRYLVAEGPVTNAFGLSREILEGHTVAEVFTEEQASKMEGRLRQNFAGDTVSYETEHNGRVYWTQQAPLQDSIGQAIIVTLDITERKRAEEALRQSEERFARFMHHLPGLAWIKDMQGRYVYANAAAQQAFNASQERLYGSTDKDIFAPDVAAQFQKHDEQALTDEKGLQVIEMLEHADGVLHSSLVNKFPIPGPDGTTTLIGGTAFDITERLKADEALRESEERFRAILTQATAGIVRKDADGRLVFVNQAFCNMLGYTESDMTGKTIWEFMHPDDVAENKNSYERLMLEGIPFNLERRLLRQDGSVIWVDASVSPILDVTGKPQSAVTVEVDITARKRAEADLQQLNLQLEERVLSRTAKLRTVNQALRDEITERQKAEEALRRSEADARANEEKLSTLFELLPVGISFLDLQGRIIQMNPALTNILKLSKEELSNEAVYHSRKYVRANGTVLPPAEFASRRAITEGKTVYNVETGVILEDHQVIWTSVSAAPVDVADVGAVVVTADITESKRAEKALQESRERLQILSQRLVEVQEEERRAIARELHDRVGQTLAALNINLIIISGQLKGKADEQTNTRLTDSMQLVAETIALVRDVMSNLRPSVLDDYGLEAAIDSHVSQYMSRYEIAVKFEKPERPIPRLGPSIEMTFLRIAQEALMNIARHARATEVHLRLWQEDHNVCMSIQDNGAGIASWESANRPGSHGLTIMRERAEAFGGSLRVSSVPGKGTKVEVKISVETNDPSPSQKDVSP
jgi:PAS domain S-box-containing protein